MDTIFALATAPGRAGVAITRISGPQAVAALDVFQVSCPSPRQASLRILRDEAGAVLDDAVVVYFPVGQSFTGEDVVELQTHGSVAVQRKIADMLLRVPGIRLADAGEFSRRALLNGRMDLAAIEGLGALLDAETEAQRKQAEGLRQGSLRKATEGWREQLQQAMALVEATLDFSDEDIPDGLLEDVRARITDLQSALKEESKGVKTAERVREGFEVILLGPPNAGKSTLINAISRREAAIVSDEPGTTRDFVEVFLDVNGIPVTFVDSAGLRDEAEKVEKLGIERTRSRAETADLRIWLGDRPDRASNRDIVVAAKSDIASASDGIPVSGKTSEGIADLLREIEQRLSIRVASVGAATHVRHAMALELAIDALTRAEAHFHAGVLDGELVAEDLRDAAKALDGLVGQIGVEDILGSIFAGFCIGK